MSLKGNRVGVLMHSRPTKATWDPIAVQDFAVAVGQEFRGKGANVILGPGVQVQRVARCGRSFEYLAGPERNNLYRGWSWLVHLCDRNQNHIKSPFFNHIKPY